MHYEVEVKSLLGNEENASLLRSKMRALDPAFKLTASNKQLNHYFTGGDISKLAEVMKTYLAPDALDKLHTIAKKGKDFSVRTRDKDGKVYLVVKASVGEDTSPAGGGTSANGITRMEFEERFSPPAGGSLDDLDQLLRDTGFEYQAKWSREREEYVCKNVAVCLDKNAGYGWLAEFEKVVNAEHQLEDARREVKALMEECGVQELPQDRLERMFAFYNAHWGEYYGTDKIFTIA